MTQGDVWLRNTMCFQHVDCFSGRQFDIVLAFFSSNTAATPNYSYIRYIHFVIIGLSLFLKYVVVCIWIFQIW